MKKQRSPLIIYTRLGRRYVRRRPTRVSNPRTPKQQANRLRFAQRYAQRNQGVSAVRPRAPEDRNQGVRPLDSIETNPSESPFDSSDPPPSQLRVISESTPMPLAEEPPRLEAP